MEADAAEGGNRSARGGRARCAAGHWPGRDHRARNTLEGWIMADAATAVAWVKAQPAEAQEILNGAVIYGLARVSPKQALDYALQLSNRSTRDWGIGEIVNGAVQEGG